jgi:uncharacterized lipoprotein YmbA
MTMRADAPAAHAVVVRRKVTAIPAAVLAAALLAACGSTQSQPKVYTSPAAPGYVMPAGQHFQGRGSKTLGTIVVHKLSKLQWASDGVVFQLWDAAQRIKVRTQEHAGTLTLRPGTYKKVEVLAFGNWLITITPG